MEILNNIWVALSTPNEGLLKIITVPLHFLENFLTMSLFIYAIGINANRKEKILYVIFSSLVTIFTNIFISSPFNIYINYLAMFILVCIIFKGPILKKVTSLLISLIIFNLVGALILNPFITLFDITSDELSTIPIYRISYMLVMYIIVAMLILIFKAKNLQLNFMEDIDNKSKYIIFINFLLGIVTIIVQSVTLYYFVDSLPILITFLNFMTFLAYFVISIYSITRVFKLFTTNKELESEKSYNKTLRILHDSVRGFKHDFDNTVTTIGGYVRTNDMEGLRKYYLQLEDDCQKVNTLYVLNPEIINNDGIYNLLTTKYHEAEEKDIKVTITVLLDLGNLKMKIYDFARILGILLDNAIEASSESDEKLINITFRNDSKNSRQLITIENSYKDKNVDTEKIFEKGTSGKENHTGLGLWEVRKILKKTNNANLFTSKTDTLFSQQLEIYY